MAVAGEAAGHDDDHCPLDHRGVVLREPFVIADGTPAPVDPGERPLDGPPAVQDDEGGLAGQLRHDLHGESELLGGPVDELAGVAGVGPDQAYAGEAGVQRPEQRSAAIAVLHTGAGDQHREQQPAGVDGDVAFTAVDLLSGVVAAAGPRDRLGAAQGLGVDQRRSRLRVAALDLPADLFAQTVVDAGQGAVSGPGLEVVVDEFVVREVGRQRVPLAAGPVEVADRVDNVAARVDDRAAAACPCRDVRGQDRPLGVAGIGRVVPGPGGGQVISEIGRGPRYGGSGDKVYRQGWAFGVRASG
jgi:hypothetical protein